MPVSVSINNLRGQLLEWHPPARPWSCPVDNETYSLARTEERMERRTNNTRTYIHNMITCKSITEPTLACVRACPAPHRHHQRQPRMNSFLGDGFWNEPGVCQVTGFYGLVDGVRAHVISPLARALSAQRLSRATFQLSQQSPFSLFSCTVRES